MDALSATNSDAWDGCEKGVFVGEWGVCWAGLKPAPYERSDGYSLSSEV